MQTKGVPIGPDASFAIAEIVMTSIDEMLVPIVGNKYHRYIDDFEFGCSGSKLSLAARAVVLRFRRR